MSVDLNGEWRLFYGPGDAVPAHPDGLAGSGLAEVTARVPGNVELDLHRAGVIDDPFVGRNMRELYALEHNEWWYVREFDAPDSGGDWELVFEGLDTYATVWVNAVEVGRSDNMLIEHRFDVTDALRPGETNSIAVRLESAVGRARQHDYDASTMSWEGREEGLFVRKPPHVWGWDIMPRAVSAGIWRSVRLERREPVAIEQLYYWTASAGAESATLGVRFQFRTDGDALDGYALRFSGKCAGSTFEHESPVEFVAGGCRIWVGKPRLWWPRGYGEPHLYTVTAQLVRDDQVLAERTDRIGIRRIEVDRTETASVQPPPVPDGEGEARIDVSPPEDGRFLFRVNGVPVMVRGTNWVPLDAYHSCDAERVDDAIALIEDLGCNMVRCWGGSVYESDRFFDLCDEKGLLVWQDFAFACCRYPQTEEFLSRVRREAESAVRRVRNHACLAIWCGDNEIDAAYVSDGLDPGQNRVSREVLPRVVHRCDPFRHYVPSSPYYSPAALAGSGPKERIPEQHLWGPRGYYKASFYTDHNAHFIGEIGYHGCPNVSSLRRFISAEELPLREASAEWQDHAVYHWRHSVIERDRIALMANQVRELFGEEPGDVETFALASQITQAEAKKFFIESTRLRKWHASGILWWNVLDGWPQISDAVVDYYFGKKLAYHYIRRAQEPVCLIVGERGDDGRLPLVACNDTREAAEIAYAVRDADTGAALAEGVSHLPAGENRQLARLPGGDVPRMLLLEWRCGDGEFGNHYVDCERPLSLEGYRAWLRAIAALPRPFDPDAVAR